MEVVSNLIDVGIYLIIDNITKFIIIHARREYRFDLLISECLILGFLCGFIVIYHHIPYGLFCLLICHIFGSVLSEKSIAVIKQEIRAGLRILREFVQILICHIYKFIKNCLFVGSSPKITIHKPVPKEWLYNYHLKPSKDLRLESSTSLPIVSRPGIVNVHGRSCSLNALLQSLASSNSFHNSLKSTVNCSRYNYDSVVISFLELLSSIRNGHRSSSLASNRHVVDPSRFILILNQNFPRLINDLETVDIVQLLQYVFDSLNDALSKQPTVYSKNIINQVYHHQLTTCSMNYLNIIYNEIDADLRQTLKIDNIDEKSSDIIRYVDVTWLLHHIQLGSIIKQLTSGQLLHAYYYLDSKRVRFQSEPFQILSLSLDKNGGTLDQLLNRLTHITFINTNDDSSQMSSNDQHSSIMIRSSIQNVRHDQIKAQTMIANFPDLLCIQLKRFTTDRRSQTTRKLQAPVFIGPEQLFDFSSIHYSTWLGMRNSFPSIPSRYRLIAVCLHLCTSKSSESIDGHYVCLYRAEQTRWFLTDDERVTEIHQINDLFQSSYVTENCYLLFLERCF